MSAPSFQSAVEVVGNTPLVRLTRVAAVFPRVEVYAKLEWFNPGGSVKDRAARQIIHEAIARGDIGGRTLIDSTSGNTGIAYAWLGAVLRVPVALVMPSNVSAARQRLTRAYGAEVIFSDPQEGSDGALRLARRLVAESPERYFYPDQYSNEANPRAHELTTGAEIWRQTQGRVTDFVAGIGTGGTVMGVGRRLKRENPAVRIHAVEPAESLHGLEGLKHMATSIVPAIFKRDELDATRMVGTDEGWDMAERLARDEGLLAGHSAGAAAVGALGVARELHESGRAGVVVCIFPDRADRYLPA